MISDVFRHGYDVLFLSSAEFFKHYVGGSKAGAKSGLFNGSNQSAVAASDTFITLLF